MLCPLRTTILDLYTKRCVMYQERFITNAIHAQGIWFVEYGILIYNRIYRLLSWGVWASKYIHRMTMTTITMRESNLRRRRSQGSNWLMENGKWSSCYQLFCFAIDVVSTTHCFVGRGLALNNDAVFRRHSFDTTSASVHSRKLKPCVIILHIVILCLNTIERETSLLMLNIDAYKVTMFE